MAGTYHELGGSGKNPAATDFRSDLQTSSALQTWCAVKGVSGSFLSPECKPLTPEELDTKKGQTQMHMVACGGGRPETIELWSSHSKATHCGQRSLVSAGGN